MADEIRLHLEMLAERKRAAGMSEEDARFAARREFGGVEQIKERCREQRGLLWLDGAAKDLTYAFRMLRKNPGFTIVAIVSLAIGIGLNTAVFSIINTIFYQSIRGVPEPNRVLIFNDGSASLPQLEHLMAQAEPVARLSGARSINAAVSIGGQESRRGVLLVPENYFAVLGARASVGRLFSGTDAPRGLAPEAVLNHSFWRTHLNGDRSVIGRAVRVNGALLTVVGVAAREFHGPGPEGPAIWVPMSMAPLVSTAEPKPATERHAIVGRLNPGVSLEQAQAAIDLITARSPELFPSRTRYRLSVGREDWRGEVSPEKRIEKILVTTVPLVAAVGLLWIACSNVGNLLLARAVQRKKEIAIRIASGASRGRLVRMLMTESLLLALFGGAAGLWMSNATLDFVFATLAQFGGISVQLDGRVLLYTVGISVVAAGLFGVAPAWQASKADVNQALKGESGSPGFRASRLRAFFLVTQIATSFALLAVAGTFVKSLIADAYVSEQARLVDHLLVAALPPAPGESMSAEPFHREALARVVALPRVEAATFVENPDVRKRRFSRPGEALEREHPVEVFTRRIDENFFATSGAVLLSGAPSLLAPTRAPLKPAIVNEAMVRSRWNDAAALGQRFRLDDEDYVVVGVVRDGGAAATAYTALSVEAARGLSLLVRVEGRAEESAALVRGVLHAMAPQEMAPAVMPLRDMVFRTLSQLTRLSVYIGALALALAAAGIYASMAFSTSQRTQEIGIRMALGATRSAVLSLVMRGGARVVLWGCGIGLGLGIVGLRLLFGMLSGSSGFDGLALGGVILFFALVATVACLLPALRATKVDPMVALRSE